MIDSLHVSGFKLFRDLTLPKLGRLNLFVGENNTGKSCLLEAIGIYAGRNPIVDIVETLSLRTTERVRPWDSEGMNEEHTSIRHPVFDLFHRDGSSITGPIMIEKIGDPSPLRVEFRYHQQITDEQGGSRYIPAQPGDVVVGKLELALPIFRGSKQVALLTRRMLPLRVRLLDPERPFNEDAFVVANLPAGGFSPQKAASMWDTVVQGPGQQLVLDWLRMLEPRILDLAYIGEQGLQRSRVALLKLDTEGRIPLRSMGDGMTKLFHVALAMASASRGILLIDEFENGLHWRVQEQLWQVLCRVARTSDVQVFATTHSRDCIEGFIASAKMLPTDDTVLYRLERIGENILASRLPLINVEAAMREHEEVR